MPLLLLLPLLLLPLLRLLLELLLLPAQQLSQHERVMIVRSRRVAIRQRA
jgi:hypothetical protein